MLNSRSPIPLYRQLADLLLMKIRTGEYPIDSRIPSEHVLARTYGIGRPTARQATDMLVRKQILMRKRGSGTFVCPSRDEVDLFSIGGTIASFQDKGIALTTKLIQKTVLKKIAKNSDNPYAGRSAYYIMRLGLVDDRPVLIEDFYFHYELFAGIDRIDMAHQSISRIVSEQYYMQPTGGRQNFRIRTVAGKRAMLLSVSSDTPILLVKRHLDFHQADDAVYSELFCRTDRFVFSQNLRAI